MSELGLHSRGTSMSSGSNDITAAFSLKLWRKCSQHPLLNSEMCNIESDHEHLMQSIGAHIEQMDLEFGPFQNYANEVTFSHIWAGPAGGAINPVVVSS